MTLLFVALTLIDISQIIKIDLLIVPLTISFVINFEYHFRLHTCLLAIMLCSVWKYDNKYHNLHHQLGIPFYKTSPFIYRTVSLIHSFNGSKLPLHISPMFICHMEKFYSTAFLFICNQVTYIQAFKYIYLCVYMYICVYVFVCVYVYACICVYMRRYIYVCIYMYVQKKYFHHWL